MGKGHIVVTLCQYVYLCSQNHVGLEALSCMIGFKNFFAQMDIMTRLLVQEPYCQLSGQGHTTAGNLYA